jgi:predicted Zn-dependent protease
LVAAIEQFDAMAVAGSPLAFSVRRGGQTLTYDVVPEAACDYPVLLDNQDIVNAFADGDRIYITQGMLRFLDSSGELATVVAHELAHNMMGHRTAKQTNMVAGAGVGLVFDILAAVAGVNTGGDFMRIGAEAGAGAFSQDFEAEADYVGVYLMARGGYEISLAPNLWRRMAIIHPASIQTNHSSTHPSTPERFIALESAVKEIRAKLAAGLPLVPEVAVDTDGEGAEPRPSTFRQE